MFWKFFAIILFILISFFQLKAEENYLEYIYVDSNTGQSSGGHTAIKFNNLIYHFQYFPDEIFHLVREDWKSFHYIYGVLENRNIQIHKIQMSNSLYKKTKEKWNEFYLSQNKELDTLSELENDFLLVESIHDKKEIYLKSLGYFSKGNKADNFFPYISKKILETIQNRIQKKIQSIQIQSFSNCESHDCSIEDKSFISKSSGFSLELLDLIYQKKAIAILLGSLILKDDAYFEISISKEEERKKIILILKKYKQDLKKSILQILQSDLKWKGQNLLILIARFLVIEKSIIENKLYFLDAFPLNVGVLKKEIYNKEKQIAELEKIIFQLFHFQKSEILKSETLNDFSFSIWEDYANRQREILEGISYNKDIRSTYQRLLPLKEEKINLRSEFSNLDFTKEFLAIAKQRKFNFHERLKKKYPFDLLTQNCTTELIEFLNQITNYDSAMSKRYYGGYTRGKEKFNFIPFVAFFNIGNIYNKKMTENIDSYRIRSVQKRKQNENFILVELQESNTISSKLYEFNAEDSFFLFFTDDKLLTRPILGIPNLLVGIGQLVKGIFTWPFDGGEEIKKGTNGVLFSLPELVFFNIRKGYFISAEEFETEMRKKSE